ncbi:MAG: twin transmembrane helix small protein [Alphaproteobacteria bacterium]|nr:twin transmembrane helix small protein [Alphaproteobacteria bacterium]
MTILNLLLFAALAAVLISLFYGLFGFLKGESYAKKNSNATMRLRVLLQGLALLIFFLFLWFK